MNITLRVEHNECVWQAEEVSDGLLVDMKVVISAENIGDPGFLTAKARVFNDEGQEIANKSKRFHLDTNETKKVTINMQKTVPPGSDFEVYYAQVEEVKRELD